MNYGFDNNKFYFEFSPANRPIGNLRQEAELRAREIFAIEGTKVLGLSGGIDSQITLHSFLSQGFSVNTVFFHTPGHNDHELNNVKFLDAKYSIKTEVITIDPYAHRDEIEQMSAELDIPGKYQLLQRAYAKHLPDDWHYIQNLQDPFVWVFATYKRYGFCQGYYSPEVSRIRAMESLNRKGQFILFGGTAEYLVAMIDNDIHRAGLASAQFFDGNGLAKANTELTTHDRWDYYLKPLVYANLWGNEIEYFPKSNGYERLEFLYLTNPEKSREHAICIPLPEFIEQIKSGTETKRFYENVPPI